MSVENRQIDACPDGQHEPVWDSETGETVCKDCGLSGSRIVNLLGHDLY